MSVSPSGRAAAAHAALALGGLAIGTTEFATMAILPLFSRGLGVAIPIGARAISAYALGVVVGAPLLAAASARAGRRGMLLLLLAWIAAGNLLSAFAPSFGALLACRFLSGLPHGAYFGLAALVASDLVRERRRAVAVGRVMAGLTLATVVGAPLANLLAQAAGWRACFVAVTAMAVASAAAVRALVPAGPDPALSGLFGQFADLRRVQVWLTLATGAVGFGGMFAIYTFLVPTLAAVTRASPVSASLVLALFGVGMTAGNLVVPPLAGRAPMRAAGALLLLGVAASAVYPLAAHALWSMSAVVVALGLGGALGTLLQTRLMDVAGDAQAVAAALNHSAFNIANALGPWLAGTAIAAGGGWTSAGWVAAGLSVGGLVICSASLALDRHVRRALAPSPRRGGRPHDQLFQGE